MTKENTESHIDEHSIETSCSLSQSFYWSNDVLKLARGNCFIKLFLNEIIIRALQGSAQ
jgi:hypothetical protein